MSLTMLPLVSDGRPARYGIILGKHIGHMAMIDRRWRSGVPLAHLPQRARGRTVTRRNTPWGSDEQARRSSQFRCFVAPNAHANIANSALGATRLLRVVRDVDIL